MKSSQLLIFGTGTLAELAFYYFTTDTSYDVVGFVDQEEVASCKASFLEKPVLTWSQAKQSYAPDCIKLFVAIGYRKTNKVRQERYDMILNDGYQFVSYVSSKAVNMASSIGANCFILENNVLQPYVEIGNNVTLWSGNHVGHHSVIGDHAFITSHVVISGKCKVGANSFIGVNACLRDGIEIGDHSVVGSGSIVMNDCPVRSVFVPPATESRVIKRDII